MFTSIFVYKKTKNSKDPAGLFAVLVSVCQSIILLFCVLTQFSGIPAVFSP